MECRFCDIDTTGKQRVYEVRERVVVIFSNPRFMPGHLLVIPKRHVTHLSELSGEERKELFDTAIELQSRILEKAASGCDLKQHDRSFLPESDLKVNHVHLHLQPREPEDELYTEGQIHERKLFKPLLDEEVEKYKKLLL
ncbi:MAG: HIT family protein [Minisyncoccia bacterium]